MWILNGLLRKQTDISDSVETDEVNNTVTGVSFEEPVPDMGTPEGAEISFETADLDGDPVSSAELFAKHRITLVNLWFSTCPFCIDELPDLESDCSG